LGIAIKNGVTLDALKEANGLTSDAIRIGDELVIPPKP
jgi:LysM repeat protein